MEHGKRKRKRKRIKLKNEKSKGDTAGEEELIKRLATKSPSAALHIVSFRHRLTDKLPDYRRDTENT